MDTSAVLEDAGACAEQYICSTDLYSMSILAQVYDIIIDHNIVSPVQVKYIIDGLNYRKKLSIHFDSHS